MSRRIGLVTRSSEDDMAEVVTDRSGACGGCERSHGCRSCLTSAKIVSTVQNPVGAAAGDVVTIDIAGRGLWTGALLFYVFPVVCMIAGAGAGAHFGVLWFSSESGLSIVVGLLGLGVGLLLTALISRSSLGNTLLRPKITGIVEKSGNRSTNNGRILPPGEKSSCCGS